VLAVLLENSGQVGQAIVTLEKSLQANPADRDTANALRLYCARSANARCPEKYKPN
jgi:predicted TPR repeat methyltransferase